MCDATDAPSPSVANCFFAPMVSRYAAIRIDPIATVESYKYTDIQGAARRLETKTYLVFVDQALQIPIPDSPWFGYCITPIAPCLRPADEENGVTPDMCIPILPNKGHPLGRSGLETQPALPFDNCYWSDARCQMDVRVHASPNQFDDDTSIKLPPPERTKIPRFMREDYARMRALREQRAREPRPDQPSQCQDNADAHNILEEAQQLTDVGRVEAVSEGTPALHGCTGDKIGGTMTDAQCGSIEQDESARPTSISDYDQSSGEYSPSPSVMKEVTQQIRTGVIRDKFSRQVELKPLVDLWYDLPGHLKQDSIPNPIDLFFRTGDLDKGDAAAMKKQPLNSRKDRKNRALFKVSVADADTRGQRPCCAGFTLV